ncbi:alpha/beta hydrolase family protein [Kitasatospora sp. NPDC049285]|uniref:alpha/beta fold hydrolase n=1 Tax=Kitasatospora sp. NPDC049285 TaxID=3157096 RepID=UPI003412216D
MSAVFVLVHGAWTGSYVWRPVRTLLRRAGHEVFTPTLTGLGERVHLAHPGLDLDTHVLDVVNLLRYEDLREVVLVGHSYGGAVATVAADRVPERIAQLVLLDALLVRDGRSVQDLRRRAIPESEDWVAPPHLPHVPAQRLARMLPAARLSLQPARTFRQPVSLAEPPEERPFGRWYVRAARRGASASYDTAAERARTHQGWHYREVDAGHDLMLSAAEETARLLAETARG